MHLLPSVPERGFLACVAFALCSMGSAQVRDHEPISTALEAAFVSTGHADQYMAVAPQRGVLGLVDPWGFSVSDPSDPGAWSQRLELIRIGRAQSVPSSFVPTPVSNSNAELVFTNAFGATQYVVSQAGIRQNFLLNGSPTGKGELIVELRTIGPLIPRSNGPLNVAFIDGTGGMRCHFEDLRVWDADHFPLHAHMEVQGDRIMIIVSDVDARYPITIDPIATVPNTTMVGAQAGMDLGRSVATAGDLNGDGRSDVVVGAWLASLGQSGEGAAYVYYGSNTGIPSTPSVTLQSDQVGAQFGCAVSTAGDVNGDGYSDLIVGARTWESTSTELSEGGAFIYYGSATGISATANVILQPDHAGDNFGSNVACAGDLNNDGYSDVLVGAYLAEYPSYQEGMVFVHMGSAAGINPVAAHRLERNVSAVHFGRSVASAGDVNGDGYSDIIIGAPDWLNVNPDAGAAFVYHGTASGLGAGGVNPPPTLTLLGSTISNGSFGWSVTCAGDVNGDGYSDVAVGAYLDFNSGQTGEGSVRVFHGSAGGLSTTPAIVLESNQATAWMGRSVSTAGDVNGDGYADLLVGIPQYTNPESLEGVVRLYYGSAVGITIPHVIQFELNDAGANLGESVCTAGDVNGDGYSDIVLGAPYHGSGGAAAIFHGGPYSTNLVPATTKFGGATNAQLGWCVANAGDVNGDGYTDAIVGAPGASNGQAGEGLAYFYAGSTTGLNTIPTATLEANIAGAQFGWCVASAGDVNGDGFADVAVGAPSSAGGGMVYVYLGSAAGIGTSPALSQGGSVGSQFGYSVSTAGDVDSDGYADLLIGAPGISTFYLHKGAPNGPSGTPTLTRTETPIGNGYGSSVATAGDLNGDGYSDVVIGAPTFTNGQTAEGAAFIYLGSATGLVTPFASRLELNQANADFGRAVAGAGDLNADGYFDLVIGADLWESGQVDEGGAFIFLGSSGGIPAAPNMTLQRNIAGAGMGCAVAEAGDVNGDGYADIVVGSHLFESTGGTADEGAAYVYKGSSTGVTPATVDVLESNLAGYRLGYSVSGGGDIEGDGYSEVLAGAPAAAPLFTNEGGMYWYRGNQGKGLNRQTRQYHGDLVSPLSTNGNDWSMPGFFGIGHRARSPIQRTELRLRWEVVTEGVAFSGAPLTNSVLSTGTSVVWTNAPITGQEVKQLIAKVPYQLRYRWRVRVEYPVEKMIDGQRFSRWFYGFASGVGDIGVLPVELLAFSGEAEGTINRLQWITATENSSDRFIIERSVDGDAFAPIGWVPAAGESLSERAYAFVDETPPTGLSYYRLRIRDMNGAEELSDVVSILRSTDGITVHPNPAQDLLSFSLANRTGISSVRIVDAMGREILRALVQRSGMQEPLQLEIGGLAPGQYALVIMDAQGTVHRSMFIKE